MITFKAWDRNGVKSITSSPSLIGACIERGTEGVSNTGGRSLNGYGSVLPFDGKTLFVADANSYGLTHFRSFGSRVIGLEDLKGGGDQDFDDLILIFDFQLTSV